MSRNIDQVYTDNPTFQIPGINGISGDCLIYLGIDPLGPGDDSAILASDFSSSFLIPMNNLSDVNSAGTARQNLQAPGTSSGSGDPTGVVAGTEGDFYIDLVTSELWVCTSTGSAMTAVWALVSSSGSSPIIAGAGTGSAIGGNTSTVHAAGDYGFAYGDSSCSASGQNSYAFGTGAIGSGAYSYGFGNTAAANADYSWAFGNGVSANGTYSFAFGNISTANHNGCFIIGDSNSNFNFSTAVNQFKASFAGGFFFYGSSINVETAGEGLRVKEGSDCKQGTVTLSAGVGVVSNTSVTANSRIFYCGQDTNVTGFLNITAITPATGFTITSSQATDSGVVAYEIFEPAA